MEWKKQIPNQAGYWLRVNVVGSVEMRRVWVENRIPRYIGKLMIIWGWGYGSWVEVEKIKARLGQFRWYGPLPEPPVEVVK